MVKRLSACRLDNSVVDRIGALGTPGLRKPSNSRVYGPSVIVKRLSACRLDNSVVDRSGALGTPGLRTPPNA